MAALNAAMADPSDPDLERPALEALGRADHDAALEILMAAYGTAIYRFCRRMVSDAELADDVHQMTFVQAYESLGRFRRRSTLRAWLYGIARHRCLDALKATRRRQARFESVPELPENVEVEGGAQDHLLARARALALDHCLRELAAKARAAILLRFHDGLSYPEMARVCGERAPTLQARVARAMPALRHCIESEGHGS